MHFLLLDRNGKRRLIEPGKDIHTERGIIKSRDIKPGNTVKTHLGHEFLVLEPNLSDIIQTLPCGAKPIFEYHSAIFASLLGLEKGKSILEAGTGSGGATLMFANFVYPGKVYSFEKEERFYRIAKDNIAKTRFDNIELINDDVLNAGNYLDSVDAIFLDLQDPENKIAGLVKYLKPGGFFGVYSPVFDSVEPVWREFEKNSIIGIRAIALTIQKIVVKKYARFGQEFFGFPGFFIWGRRWKDEDR